MLESEVATCNLYSSLHPLILFPWTLVPWPRNLIVALEVTPTPLKPQPTTWMVVAEDVRSACYHTSPIKIFDRDVSHHHIHSSTCKQSVHLSSFDFKIFNFNDTITFFPLNPPDQLQPASSFHVLHHPLTVVTASIKRTDSTLPLLSLSLRSSSR